MMNQVSQPNVNRFVIRYIVVVYLFALLSFSLWDFYFGEYTQGYRLLELASVVFLIAVNLIKLLTKGNYTKLKIKNYIFTVFFIGVLFISGFVGFLDNPLSNYKVNIGIILGLLVYFIFFYNRDLREYEFRKIIETLTLIMSSALILQYVCFVQFGFLINYHSFLNLEPRVYSSIFRPSGLFLEPSSHAVTMIMLLITLWAKKFSFGFVPFLGVVSILLCQSLFGFLALGMTIIFFSRVRLKHFIRLIFFLAILAFIVISAIYDNTTVLANRVFNLGDDSSVLIRYSGLFTSLHQESSSSFLFGNGISNNYLNYGTSGYSFLLSSVGLFGLIIFILFFVLQSPVRRRKIILFSLGLVLFAAPMFTVMFFWAWLGIMTNRRVAP